MILRCAPFLKGAHRTMTSFNIDNVMFGEIKLRMEIGNVSKRQPDQKAENGIKPPKGLQHSEKIQRV